MRGACPGQRIKPLGLVQSTHYNVIIVMDLFSDQHCSRPPPHSIHSMGLSGIHHMLVDLGGVSSSVHTVERMRINSYRFLATHPVFEFLMGILCINAAHVFEKLETNYLLDAC